MHDLRSATTAIAAPTVVNHTHITQDERATIADIVKQLVQASAQNQNREQLFIALTEKWTQLAEASNSSDRPLIDEEMRQAFAAVSKNVEARRISSPSPSIIIPDFKGHDS
jgi:K+/H+ antiporter YhaU regulatory subunit KhtT